MADLATIASYLDDTLRTREIPDYPQALNGVQLENDREITRVAAAVDFSSYTVGCAIENGANLLIVHHGMFWGGLEQIRGRSYQRIAALVRSGTAVYASHLPLDLHPTLGNNVLLARALGLDATEGFARYKTIEIGVAGAADVLTRELVQRATQFAVARGGSVVATPHAAERRTHRFGICTGAGASTETLNEAADRGIDTLIVGEGPHHTAVHARDADIVVIYAGHYATETLGVHALAQDLAGRFGIQTQFIDAPTGL